MLKEDPFKMYDHLFAEYYPVSVFIMHLSFNCTLPSLFPKTLNRTSCPLWFLSLSRVLCSVCNIPVI